MKLRLVRRLKLIVVVTHRLTPVFFVLVLVFSSFQFTFGNLLVNYVEAASKTPGHLRTKKAQIYKPEAGASGRPIKGEEVSLVNDPANYTPPANFKEEEVISEREANKTVTRKSDGTYEAKVFYDAVNYQKDGAWETIDKTLIEDKNAADSSHIFGRFWGNVRSIFTRDNAYKVKANDWQARFAPTGDKMGMLRYQKGIFDISFQPVNARSGINPVVTYENDIQTIMYHDVWEGVDLQYEVTGSKLKEFIIVKHAGAETRVGFEITGAELEEDKDNPGGFKIIGLEGVDIAPLSVSLNNFGPYTDEPVAEQKYEDGKLKVEIDKDWLKSLDSDKFPVIIDPTVQNGGIGLQYIPYKSDGFVGSASNLWMNAGTSLDNYKKWRTAFNAPFSFLQGKTLLGAGMYLSRALYTTESLYYEVSHANCLCYNGINYNAPRTSAWFGQDAWINVYPQYKWLTDQGAYSAWMMLNGEERNHYTLKGFRDNSYVQFTYTTTPPITSPIQPANSQVLVTDQPMLSVNPITGSDGDQVKYYFRVATNSDAETGTVFNSGWIDSPTWTLPEGTLQDDMTYYWHVYSSKWNGGTFYAQRNPNWVRSFKVDLRNGKDPTQNYDSAGPVSVNLATGNAVTSANTHGMEALGGNIGIGLDYNSPYRSKPGLVAEYFNNKTFSGNPVVTRVEANIDNQWGTGSPSAGVVPVDNFSAKYKGYFVTPKTGSYQFGALNDDTVTIIIDGQTVHTNGGCYSSFCYGSAVNLNEGDVVPIEVRYVAAGGADYIRLAVKGVVPAQVIPTEMLRTEPRLVSNSQGLQANYYSDSGSHVFPSSTTAAFASRRESKLSFNWGAGSPVPTGPVDNWMASYDGYITAPTTGSYQFGANNDDAARIWINGQLVMDQWANDSNVGSQWGSSINLEGGKAVPIRVEYYEKTGGASLYLNVRGAVTEQEVPASWLSVKAPLLPNGWNISLDADGSLRYDYAIIRPNSVLLVNADGSTSEYTWNGSGYKPPVNEYGTLIKNQDGTLTLQDSDGITYAFGTDGMLKSTTSPTDDRQPASLQYEYSSSPTRLSRIIDPVDSDRTGTVRYKGDNDCPSAPGGFDAEAPNNMICSFETSDGNSTKFFYKDGQLARIELPGGAITDLGYDTLGRVVQQRSSLANDAIQASVRANDAGVTTEVAYDMLGRVSKVTEPAPNAGDSRREHTYTYRDAAKTTILNVSNSSEPNGYTSKVEYDSLYRATKIYDKSGNMSTVEYDPVKDLVLSSTTPTGLKSTTIYDTNDRPISGYGPAPTAWFGTDRKPLATYINQVPRTDTAYDEGIIGAEVTWYNAKNDSLVGAPRLHATGFDPANPSKFWINTGNPASPVDPIQPTDGATNIGFRAVGKLYVPTNGTYTLNLWHANAVRVWVDNKLVINGWSYRSNTVVQKTAQVALLANTPSKVVVEYANLGGGITAVSLEMSGPGFTMTDRVWGAAMRPDYGLSTSTTVHDSQLGNTTVAVDYGDNPELGQIHSTTTDVGGLGYVNTATYEAPGTTNGYLRQTSSSLPGGNTTAYAYYGADEAIDNPCTVENDPASQAGFGRLVTEQDPDGGGSATSRTKEVVYDATGRGVASRVNNDPWTCVTYDTRGRITQTIQPDVNGRPGRTVITTYSHNNNPFWTKTTDSVAGSSEQIIDLLGRTVWSKDVWGDEYTTDYDANGRVDEVISPVGTEKYIYDNLDRVVDYKLDNTTLYTVTYDQYSRIETIEYPEAKDDTTGTTLRLSDPVRDSLQRTIGSTMRLGSGDNLVETVSLSSQVSKITGATQTLGAESISQSYSYDGIGRMTSATVGNIKYDYGYGAPDSSCTTLDGYNANAHKDSNRTSQTVTDLTSSTILSQNTHCYDLADRLIESTDVEVGAPTYDDHGNTATLEGNGEEISFSYDASDYNIAIEQGDNKVEYLKSASGAVLRKKEYVDDTLTKNYRYVAGGRILQECNVADDNSCGTLDTYIGLPGGVTMTLSPGHTDPDLQTRYSLSNFHGDTVLILDRQGHAISDLMAYGPFGEPLPNTDTASNASDAVMGWAANPGRKVQSGFSLAIVQMGARVYLPTLGRFLQVDPVQGGTPNPYVYVTDPVNSHDYSGLLSVVSYVATWTVSGSYVNQASSGSAARIQPAASVSNKPKASASSKSKSTAKAAPTISNGSAGINPYGLVGGVMSFADDASDGFKTQASVFGRQLQQGSSIAARNLPSAGRLARNPVIGAVGRVAAPIAFGVEAAGNYFEGDSIGRNALKTGFGTALGAGGAALGGVACGYVTFGSGGLAAATCPTLVGGLGTAGAWIGNKIGEGLSNLFGW